MTSRSTLSLRGLRTFCVVARHESFREAAEALFVTASAVSHQIKSLEQEIGEPLFVRHSRSISLTEIGRSLYEDVSPLIEQLDSIAAGYRRDRPRSSIRISVQPFFASEFFVPRLAEFTAEHPDFDIQVKSSDESREKLPTDADLSIRLFGSPPPNVQSDHLFQLRTVPAGSPEFCKTVKVTKKKIKSEFPIIVHETYPTAWEQWSKATGITLPKGSKVVRLDTMIAAVRAAERGIGAAMVPVPLGDAWFESGSLVRLFKQELVADVGYYLVCRQDRMRDEGVRALRAWILETFSEAA